MTLIFYVYKQLSTYINFIFRYGYFNFFASQVIFINLLNDYDILYILLITYYILYYYIIITDMFLDQLTSSKLKYAQLQFMAVNNTLVINKKCSKLI